MTYNKECFQYCHLFKSRRKCEVGDPINKAGSKDFTTLCIYYPCIDARGQAGLSWTKTNWSNSVIPGIIEPDVEVVLIDGQQIQMEVAKFETPKQKEARIYDGYQMYINYDGDILARSRLDRVIHPVGVNIWESKDLY